jgi:endonuclease/exonuclease/phosphatase family metal-dependent hydrolase
VIAALATAGANRTETGTDPAARAADQTDPVPKVLLVGWDGVRPDVLREVPTPNFDALAAAGAFSETAVSARPTVSGPCWSSILTGVWPEKHGVLSNNFTTNRYDTYPDFFTLIERVRPELNTFVVADWLPLVAENSGGPLLSDEIDRKVVLNGYDLGWLEADSISVDHAVEELRTGDPDILFVYAGSPDEISHNIGGLGREYREAIVAADRQLGRLLEAIRARPSYPDEDWLILLTTDHGRTEEGGHGGITPAETTVYYLASGPSVPAGSLVESPGAVDLAATALAHLGIEADPAWELDGRVTGLEGGVAVAPFPRTDTLRILAYNTHHGEGLDGLLDLERIAGLIQEMDPDVVTLQEIDRVVERTGGVDQAAAYGALTGMESRFGDFMEYQGGHYGMAILSRVPILETANHRLPDGAEPRTALTVRVRLPGTGREALISGIHFYRTEEERLAQAESLMDALTTEDGLVILAGDFNSLPGSPVMELLDSEWAITEKSGLPFTFPADGPVREIDYILVRPDRGFRVLDYRVLDETVASDHRPILMVIEF